MIRRRVAWVGNWFLDLHEWLFMSEGISWSVWRDLGIADRRDGRCYFKEGK